jgi:predicted Zn-dependent peptidase
MAHNRIISSREIVERIDAVTAEDVRATADRMLRSQPSITVVGAGARSADAAHNAARRLEVPRAVVAGGA